MSQPRQIILTSQDLRKYPFLPQATEKIRSLGIDLADLAQPYLLPLVERAAEDILEVIKRRRLPVREQGEDVEEAVVFTLHLLFLRLVNDSLLTRRFAVAFARRTRQFLEEEDTEKLVYILRTLGIELRHVPEDYHGYTLGVNVFHYVDNIPEHTGPWRLVHRLLSRGLVYVSKHEAARLGEEALRKYIEARVQRLNVVGGIPPQIQGHLERIRVEWGKILEEMTPSIQGEAASEAFPPCISTLLEDLRRGRNVPHSGRFALASFLVNIGLSPEEILEMFRVAPDFREDIARYQVEHIAGLRGSRRRYTPYKCENMRTLGLCKWNCNVSHPLQYYYKVMKNRRRKPEKETV